MKIFFATLGVIITVVLILLIVYKLYFKPKSDKPGSSKHRRIHPFDKDEEDTGDTNNFDGTILPPQLSFTLESTGQRYEVYNIPEGGVTVGRSALSDIVVTSPKGNFLSAEHFVIGSDDEGLFLNVVERAHNCNGIRLEPDLNSEKIRKSISITHKLKIYIGNDAVTFYLPYMADCDEDVTPVADNRVVRRR